jgi:hypothetical protein
MKRGSGGVLKDCVGCGQSYRVKPYRAAVAKFCSLRCASIAMQKRPTFVCSECGVPKAPEQFYRDRHKQRGYVPRCKACFAKKQAQSRIDRPQRRFSEHRKNAITRGLAWDLTLDDYVRMVWRAPCYYCGEDAGGGMDRINNEPYYDLSNVLPCCRVCNAMKSAMTLSAFLSHINKIAKAISL